MDLMISFSILTAFVLAALILFRAKDPVFGKLARIPVRARQSLPGRRRK